MSCPYGREDLSAYIDAEVDESTHSGIREHLRVCPKCRREVAWLRALAGMVAGLPRAEPEAPIAWGAEGSAAPTLRCPVVLPEASAFIDGELPPEGAHAVVAHLAACDPCHRAYKDLERISGMMVTTEPASVPAGLEARIAAAVAAERRFSLRRLFSRTCDACFPVARVSLRFAAAAALLLIAALGVWRLVGPGPRAPLAPVVVPTMAVAAVPEVGNPSFPTVPTPPAVEPTGERDRYGAAEARVTRLRSTPVAGGDGAVRPGERPPSVGGGRAPTVVRPPGRPATTPAGPGSLGPVPPRPAESAPRTMVAVVSPSQPAPPAVPAATLPGRPPSVPGKSTPGGDGARRPPPAAPPLIRLANLPEPAPAEGDADVHVHVTRSGADTLVSPAARGISPDHLRAAEARMNASTRAFVRSQPTRFPLNP
jgi:anti-sigma factor RsiW